MSFRTLVVVMTALVLAVVAVTMTADVEMQALAMMMTAAMMMTLADKLDTRLCPDLFFGHGADRCCGSWKRKQPSECCCT